MPILNLMSGDNARWQSRPYLAGFIRLAVFVAPILLSIGLMILVSRRFPRPEGFIPAASWWVGISGFSTIVILIFDRWFRRLLPVVALFRLSLIFPDKAPSRFKTALRAGTVRQLERQMESNSLHEATPQIAAEQLIALAGQLNAHDRLTRGHTERVRAYSVMIGQEMGLSDHDLELLNWSGLIHDIGKLAVPKEILNKAGKPTDEEWLVLKKHPAQAKELIEPLRSWLGDWAESATQHHERFDGKGYPLGLAGREITLAGRIVAVADAYDVMTSVRSYKEAMPAADARQELVANAGTQFDPIVVRAFLGIAIGKLRLVAGPLSSLIQLPAGSSTLGSAAATGVSATAAVAVSAFTGIVNPTPDVVPPTPPPALAMVVEAEDFAVFGTEDDGPVRIHGGAPGFGVGATFEILEQTIGGEILTREDGSVVFVPDAEFSGTVTVPYRVCVEETCDEGVVTIDIAGVNDGPVAIDDVAQVDEDTVASIDVLANDVDVDGDRLRISSIERVEDPDYPLRPANLRFAGSRIVIVPEPDDFGSLKVAYEVRDDAGEVAFAVLTLEVTPVNDRPDALPDSATMIENTQIRVDVLANDEDIDGDDVFIERVDAVENGTASIVDGQILFSPSTDFTGSGGFTYTMHDGNGGRASAPVSIEVLVDPNRIALTTDRRALLEDSTGVTVDVLANDSSGAGLDATSLAIVRPADNGLVSVTNGTIVYMPDADWFGVDTLDYVVCDVSGQCANETVTLSVIGVNDRPSFVAGADVEASEGAGPVVVPAWASSISKGPFGEAAQTVAFGVTAADPSLFSVQPTISPAGELRLTPAPDANGSTLLVVELVDSGGVADGGVDRTAPVMVVVTIDAVNDAPSFVAGPDVAVPEDSGTYVAPGWATSISPGPADEAGQSVVFDVQVSNTGLFSVQPSLSSTGELRFAPAPGANGSATVTVTAIDNGGTARGGDATSVPSTFTISVTAVNDAPVAVDDSGVGFATAEDTLFTTPDVTANDSDVDDGAIDPTTAAIVDSPTNGTLTNNGDGTYDYLPDADFTGIDSFTYQVNDSGNLLSNTATVTIVVGAVNDAPSFVPGGNVTVQPDSGAQSRTGWATSISPGPADESAQTVAFNVTSDNMTLFTVQPAISMAGELTFTAAGLPGSATVDVTLTDDGGTADGGADTSSTIQFAIELKSQDFDAVPYASDNCPNTFNIDQLDTDNDGLGDACDPTPTSPTSPGTFSPFVTFGTRTALALAAGDIDGDDDLDVLIANDGQADRVISNPFFFVGQDLGNGRATDVKLGDLDGDGDLDAVFAKDGIPNTVWFNNGAGNFANSGQALGSSASQAIELGDFDGDDDLDLVVANDGEPDAVWLNDGSGVFTDSGIVFDSDQARDVRVGDLDGDLDLDLVFSNDGSADTVWFNDGTGAFTNSGQTLGSGETGAIVLIDVDSDGDIDLAIAGDNDPSILWINDGTGTFTDGGEFIPQDHWVALVSGDIDGDGDIDLLAGTHGNEDTILFINDGTGTFVDEGDRLGSTKAWALVLADFDGDGDLDAIVGDDGADVLWRNN